MCNFPMHHRRTWTNLNVSDDLREGRTGFASITGRLKRPFTSVWQPGQGLRCITKKPKEKYYVEKSAWQGDGSTKKSLK